MSNGTGGGRKNSKHKILGGTSLQVGEDDVSRLVGGIVEKGFSQVPQTRPLAPPSAPRHTVLPFPAARHRSHGPHWAPKAGNFNVRNDHDNEDDYSGYDEGFDGMETAAVVANPVQRKEKKGLDFSRWREIVKNDVKSAYNEKDKVSYSNEIEVGQKERKMASSNRPIADRDGGNLLSAAMDNRASKIKEVIEETKCTSLLPIAEEFQSFRYDKNKSGVLPKQYQQDGNGESVGSTVLEEASTRPNQLSKELDLKMRNMQKSFATSGFSAEKLVGGEKDNLQNEIDSENRARLADMSVDEIAEAQAEIMAKLNPKLIDALKKRGQAKAKRQKSSLTDVSGSALDSMGGEEALPKSSGNAVAHESMETVPGDAPKNKDDIVSPNVSPDKGSIWNAWSKRVERAREVRFSIDGDIVGFGLESDVGQYNSNNVSQRDYLRTEGDPGAAGYTIKEAIALARSVVPGQRTLALSVIASILNRAIYNISRNQVDPAPNFIEVESADWVAIWAYALGPEPELALSLRISLDDNHNNVVLTCCKAILSALSYDMNNIFFDIWEKTPTYSRDVFTAPVFRSKPDVNVGFLRGGFWKYNAKPSNILRFGEELVDDNAEGEFTIQDDVVVAGQDFAAGLVRMGILERICYLLETDPAAPLEECLLSILVAIARHSPTCAAAVLDCGRLVQTVSSRFLSNGQMEINSCKIKSVTLFKVLARHNRKNCSTFTNNGILRRVTWHLYRYPFSIDQWVKMGRESCILLSALLVEQLRLWKVSIHYGFIISDVSDLFTALRTWLILPAFEKLLDKDLMNEYCAVVREVYILLDISAHRLPKFYSHMHGRIEDATQDTATWSWGEFGPIIDLALEWIQVKNIPYLSRLFNSQRNELILQDSIVNSLLWVISSVLSMLGSLLESVTPEDIMSLPNGKLPWLPDFVPKTGLGIIKNGYFRFTGLSDRISNTQPSENSCIVEYLCGLRLKGSPELAISSQCCLHGLIRVVNSVDKLVQNAKLDIHTEQSRHESFSRDDRILASGILKSSTAEKQYLVSTLRKAITSDWKFLQPIEVFGRGGPAPGVGVGWGASGGGYWSLNALLAQQDARLLVYSLEESLLPSTVDPSKAEAINDTLQKLNCALTTCLIVGPGNSALLDKLLTVVFQVPVLKCLDLGIHQFLHVRKGYRPFKWKYDDDEYLLFANVLSSHFRTRWLGSKRKQKATSDSGRPIHTKKDVRSLETIHEDMDVAKEAGEQSSSLVLEWAHQRLPLPAHWFLTAICNNLFDKTEVTSDFVEVAKSGLFFLLGIEAIPTSLSSDFCSPVNLVPLVWKLHATSATLVSGMAVLEDEKSRDVFETLQNIYGEALDEQTTSSRNELGTMSVEPLKFKSDIHENYSTFIESLVEQYAAESYGDVIFGRQVAVYLHRSVEASVRLAAWNTLSNGRVLELLPPLHKCLAKAAGYLEPIEDNEAMLEAYAKSWEAGALDKAASRSSVAFSLALHHLSSFIFGDVIAADAISLRKKLVKSLLRDYARKQQHEGMMVKLVCYKKLDANSLVAASETAASSVVIHQRLQLLREICDGCAVEVQKLEDCLRKEVSID